MKRFLNLLIIIAFLASGSLIFAQDSGEDIIFQLAPDWYRDPLGVGIFASQADEKNFFTGYAKIDINEFEREYVEREAIRNSKIKALQLIGVEFLDEKDFRLLSGVDLEKKHFVNRIVDTEDGNKKTYLICYVLISIKIGDYQEILNQVPVYLSNRVIEKQEIDKLFKSKIEMLNEKYSQLLDEIVENNNLLHDLKTDFIDESSIARKYFKDSLEDKQRDILTKFKQELKAFYKRYSEPKGYVEKLEANKQFNNIIEYMDSNIKILKDLIKAKQEQIINNLNQKMRIYDEQLSSYESTIYSLKNQFEMNFTSMLNDSKISQNEEMVKIILALQNKFDNQLNSILKNISEEREKARGLKDRLRDEILNYMREYYEMVESSLVIERDFQYYKYYPKEAIFERTPEGFGYIKYSINLGDMQAGIEESIFSQYDFELSFYQQFMKAIFLKINFEIYNDNLYFTNTISTSQMNFSFFTEFIFSNRVLLNFGYKLPIYYTINGGNSNDFRVSYGIIGLGYLSEGYDTELWYTNISIGILRGICFDVRTRIVFSDYILMNINFGSLLNKFPIMQNIGFEYGGKNYIELEFIIRVMPSYSLGIGYNSSMYGRTDFFLFETENQIDTVFMTLVFNI